MSYSSGVSPSDQPNRQSTAQPPRRTSPEAPQELTEHALQDHAQPAIGPVKITRLALIVWGAGMLVYTLAVAGRTSFGVAGVQAMSHFHINANQLAVFTTLQLATYAIAQIPAGILIDRFGARKLLVAGAVIMAVGQVVLGFADDYPVALGARALVGLGDATAFLSVMRLVPAWIPVHRAPIFAQLTSAIGQLGQFLSAVPFLALLHATSWQVSFVLSLIHI